MGNRLQKLESSQLELIRNWRNDDSIRQYMFHQHDISASEHQSWFESAIQNEKLLLLIYIEQDEPVGFMQLNLIDRSAMVYEWGFYTAPHAPKGTGSRMAVIALDYLFTELNANKVFAQVLSFNEVSRYLHKKFHFVEEGVLRQHACIASERQDVYCFGLLKSEWATLSTVG